MVHLGWSLLKVQINSDPQQLESKFLMSDQFWYFPSCRAVANYLQLMFEKESDQAKKVVSLENLLIGKTRKEASRMFFETLVREISYLPN